MIEINLLKDLGDASSGMKSQTSAPVDVADAVKKVFVIVILIVISVGAGVVFNTMKTVKKNERQVVLNGHKAEIAELDKTIQSINSVNAETQQIDDKLYKMKEIFDLRVMNIKALDSIRVNIPNQIFLKKLSINTSNDTLKMTGMAESSEAIKQFVGKLSVDPAFEEGKVLLDLERKVIDAIEFEVSAKVFRKKYAKNQ